MRARFLVLAIVLGLMSVPAWAGPIIPPIEGVITLFEPSPSGSSVHVVVDFGFTYDPANVDVAVI